MDAVETLLRREGAALLTTARCWLGSGPAALEAVADGVAAVGRGRDSVVDGRTLRAAVLSAAMDRLAAAPQCDEAALSDLLPAFDSSGARLAQPAEAPVALEAPARAAIVRAAVSEVPPPFRQALLLVDMEGWRCSEAAAALGVTEPVLNRRLHVARMALVTLVQRRAHPAIAAA